MASSGKELAVEKVHSRLEVERLRNKIFGELHDDIGSTLSGIAMYSHMTDGQLLSGNYDKAKGSVTVIQKSANELVGRLSDLVWVINPHHESFTAMLDKVEQYGEEMCRAKAITFTTNLSPAAVSLRLPMESRLQIYFTKRSY